DAFIIQIIIKNNSRFREKYRSKEWIATLILLHIYITVDKPFDAQDERIQIIESDSAFESNLAYITHK
ncbi:MAG: hypothetical protein QUS07_00665, partial [Methanothrix sp.]|nr:hypothetical protein [Methanothrix sp.]